MKSAGLHALSHSENEIKINDCDLCEFVVTSSDNNFNTNNQVLFTCVVINNYNNEQAFFFNYLFIQKKINTNLFCRPPPTFF